MIDHNGIEFDDAERLVAIERHHVDPRIGTQEHRDSGMHGREAADDGNPDLASGDGSAIEHNPVSMTDQISAAASARWE
ncbi:MAG: hypothetical protein R2848_02875 [Thermomicrobiales bacterium]